VLSWRLDHALAEGADPGSNTLLACRAEHLVSPRTRRVLAEGLRNAILKSVRPSAWTSAAPLAAASVRANGSRSPIYGLAGPLALERAVEAALIAL
jgi:hypothetical protein